MENRKKYYHHACYWYILGQPFISAALEKYVLKNSGHSTIDLPLGIVGFAILGLVVAMHFSARLITESSYGK